MGFTGFSGGLTATALRPGHVCACLKGELSIGLQHARGEAAARETPKPPATKEARAEMASTDEGAEKTNKLAYPSAEAADVVMADGTSIHFRPVRAEDPERLRRFLEGVSSDSMIHRFFGVASIDWVARWAVDVDYRERYAIVAELGAEREIVVGVASIVEVKAA